MGIPGLLLLALQTTTSSTDDAAIDTFVLVLVMIFIISMAGLSFLLFHKNQDDDRDLSRPNSSPTNPPPSVVPPIIPHPLGSSRAEPVPPTTPVWLQGTTFPVAELTLSDAVSVIESLLTARRDRDLVRGLQITTPEFQLALQKTLGIDSIDLRTILDQAVFQDDIPRLRSAAFTKTNGAVVTVRVGYSKGPDEDYRLVQHDGRWLIDSIEPNPMR